MNHIFYCSSKLETIVKSHDFYKKKLFYNKKARLYNKFFWHYLMIKREYRKYLKVLLLKNPTYETIIFEEVEDSFNSPAS